jgi:hypothetical protein
MGEWLPLLATRGYDLPSAAPHTDARQARSRAIQRSVASAIG